MRALFDRFGFVAQADPDDPRAVIYTASVESLGKWPQPAAAPATRALQANLPFAPQVAHAPQ
jgi:hypothetical protein